MSSSPSIVDRSPFPKTRYDLCTGHYQCRQIDGLYSIEESNVSFAAACLAQLGWTIFLKSFTLLYTQLGLSLQHCKMHLGIKWSELCDRNLKLIISWLLLEKLKFNEVFFFLCNSKKIQKKLEWIHRCQLTIFCVVVLLVSILRLEIDFS